MGLVHNNVSILAQIVTNVSHECKMLTRGGKKGVRVRMGNLYLLLNFSVILKLLKNKFTN